MCKQSTALDSCRSQHCRDTSTDIVHYRTTKWRRLQKLVTYAGTHHMTAKHDRKESQSEKNKHADISKPFFFVCVSGQGRITVMDKRSANEGMDLVCISIGEHEVKYIAEGAEPVLLLPWPKQLLQPKKFMRLIQQSDRVISCDIDLRFDIDATRGASRVADRSRCHLISHDRTADQSHEYLGCNDFLARVVPRCVAKEFVFVSLFEKQHMVHHVFICVCE